MLGLEDRSLVIFIVTTAFLGISFIAVCLRCFVRIEIVRAFGLDDVFMIMAMISNILFGVCGIVGSLYGLGQKTEVLLERGTMETAMFWWWLGQTAYVWVCALAKISIALALLRLTVLQTHRFILFAVMTVTSVVGLVFWAMITFQCHPVSYFWRRALLIPDITADVHGSCMNLNYIIDIAWVYSITATCCDVALGILPFFLIWKLQMGSKTKVSLALVLGLGGIASAAVIVRIPFLHCYKSPDFLYATTQISIWSNVEASLGIAAGSLVTLRPLFRLFGGSHYKPESNTSLIGNTLPLSQSNIVHCEIKVQHPQYWRPDIGSVETHTVVTTCQSGAKNSRPVNQNDTEPMCGSLQINRGVSIQRNYSFPEYRSGTGNS